MLGVVLQSVRLDRKSDRTMETWKDWYFNDIAIILPAIGQTHIPQEINGYEQREKGLGSFQKGDKNENQEKRYNTII